MTLVDIAEISLIIDDHNTTSFKIGLNDFDETKLSTICNDISSQYNLSVKATEKIYQQVITEIANVRKNLNQISTANQCVSYEIVARLYYEGAKKKREQEKNNEILHNQKIESELKQCSFTPNVHKMTKNIGKMINSHSQKTQKISNKELHKQDSNNDNNYVVIDEWFEKEKNEKCKEIKDNDKNHHYNTQQNYVSHNHSSIRSNRKHNTFSCDLRNQSNILINKDENINRKIAKDHQKQRNQLKAVFGKANSIIIDKKGEVKSSLPEDNNNKNKSTINNSSSKVVQKSSAKKSLTASKMIKLSTDNCFDRLYNRQSKVNEQKKQYADDYFQSYYPFEPKISDTSKKLMKTRIESPEERVIRLSNSKVISGLSNIINTAHKTRYNPPSQPKLLKNTRSNSQKQLSINTSHKHNNSFTISHNQYTDPNHKRIVEQKTEKQLEDSIKNIQASNEFNIKYYKETVNSNIEHFKLNTIKEIYEKISKEPKTDFTTLSSKGIPQHLVDKVIVPTCYMINNKNLDFNFQNFYLIASEILNKFF